MVDAAMPMLVRPQRQGEGDAFPIPFGPGSGVREADGESAAQMRHAGFALMRIAMRCFIVRSPLPFLLPVKPSRRALARLLSLAIRLALVREIAVEAKYQCELHWLLGVVGEVDILMESFAGIAAQHQLDALLGCRVQRIAGGGSRIALAAPTRGLCNVVAAPGVLGDV